MRFPSQWRSALALLLALLLLALLALVVLGLVGLVAPLGLGGSLLGLHFLLLGLDAELFVDARLKEGAKLLGIAADKGCLLYTSPSPRDA